MSATARARTFAATSCCASRSPSALWQARCRPPSLALANRPGPQKPRQKADPSKQRMATLPRRQLEFRPRMAVDLPDDVVRAAGEGRAGLREAEDVEPLPLNTPPRPAAVRSERLGHRER